MTVKELKEIIKDLPDDMAVGGSGHFGEYLECYSVEVKTVSTKWIWDGKGNPSSLDGKQEEILSIVIEDPGEEPD